MLAHLKIIPYHLPRRFCPTTTKSKYETNTATATNTWKNNPLSSANRQQHQIEIITQKNKKYIEKKSPLTCHGDSALCGVFCPPLLPALFDRGGTLLLGSSHIQRESIICHKSCFKPCDSHHLQINLPNLDVW